MAKITIDFGGSAKPISFDVKYSVARAILTLIRPQPAYGKTLSQIFMDDFIENPIGGENDSADSD